MKALACRQQTIAISAAAVRPIEQSILALAPVTGSRTKVLQSMAIVPSQQALVPSQGCLVSGVVVKNRILTSYQEEFGNGSPITTTVLGASSFHLVQSPSQSKLVKSCRMKPQSIKYYNVLVQEFFNVLALILIHWLDLAALSAPSSANKFLRKSHNPSVC